MYIKEIQISNFRNFKNASIPFHEGVNVIIGHNNTGKSNLLRAIGLVLGYSDGRRLSTNDLFYETDVAMLKMQSPRILINLVLHRKNIIRFTCLCSINRYIKCINITLQCGSLADGTLRGWDLYVEKDSWRALAVMTGLYYSP